MNPTHRPVALIILDGWGLAEYGESSARARAKTPFYGSLLSTCPSTTLSCSGLDVGLPEGQIGNSEVGHMNIGAGRIVYQDYTRINLAIRDGSIESNEALGGAMDAAKSAGGALHLVGLLSDGGVHSDIAHLYALIRMAGARGLARVFVHAFLDGRDTPPKSGLGYVRELERFIKDGRLAGRVKVASVSGRYWAMDRDNRWDRVKRAYDAMVSGAGRTAGSATDAVEKAYEAGTSDEFVEPCVIVGPSGPVGRLADGDAVISFNFRTDRAREITRAIAIEEFDRFDRPARPRLSSYVCMTEYDETFALPAAFPPVRLRGILGEVISVLGLRQLRIAETEKYAHVTFFFNGGVETPFRGEERCLIPSPQDVPTYDLKPQMSAYEVTDEVVRRIAMGEFDLIVMNYANPDMVGHTGVMDAAVKACEVVDDCLARVVPAVKDKGGIAFITADHGNVEKMFVLPSGEAHTAHTSNPVPFILADAAYRLDGPGILADVAPTVLDVMGIDKPDEMTGRSLIVKG